MTNQNYFVCPRCGQVHDVDPKPLANMRDVWPAIEEHHDAGLPEHLRFGVAAQASPPTLKEIKPK